MFSLVISLLAAFLVSLAVTLIVTPFIFNRLFRRGITGKDFNKFEKPEVAEMGGIGAIFGFSFGMMAVIFIYTYLNSGINLNLALLLAAITTIVLVGFLGIVDDLIGWKKGIKQWQHALFPIFAALPLMALKAGTTEMAFPFIGYISFGIIYSIILIPIGITGASNAFNMLAGFNGLEASLGIISLSTLFLIAFFSGSIEAMFLLAVMIGALIGFLRYNWFKAKVFPGDSLTLMIGAALATAVIIGNMEKFGVMIMALFFVELVIKARHRFKSECFGIPQKNGTLKARPEGGSITQWVMRRGKFTEVQVVLIILSMQLVVSAITFASFWFKV